MGEKSQQIERHIDEQRNQLGSNVDELQHKVKSAFDWRSQFEQRPLTVMGIAFGGGLLLSTLTSSHTSDRGYRSERRWSTREETPTEGAEYGKQRAADTWDNIKGALVGVAATKLQTLLKEAIPGFDEQFRQVKQRKGSTEANNGGPNGRSEDQFE